MEIGFALKYEKYNKIPNRGLEVEDYRQNGCWGLEDVHANVGHLTKLKSGELVETVIEINNRANWFKLADLERVESMLNEIEDKMDAPIPNSLTIGTSPLQR